MACPTSSSIQTVGDGHQPNGLSEKIDHDGDYDVFPDGGLRAWLVVCATVLNGLTTFGVVNSWGVFQAYYQTDLLRDQSPSSIAWIGSIQYSLLFMTSFLTGRLFDIGYFHSLLIVSSIILVVVTFLIAECHQYWHFLLCQGLAVGFAGNGIMAPSTFIISQWFKKRRGLAMCIFTMGASTGGTVVPILTRNLIPRVGFPWTMRIIAFILAALLLVSNLLIKRRLPPSPIRNRLVDLREFRKPMFVTYCGAIFFCFLGIYTVPTYIDVGAVSFGVPSDLSFYLVSIVNASSGFGRLGAGYLADHFGPMNVMMPWTLVSAGVTFGWPFARSKGAVIGVAVIYGFSSGAFIALLHNPVMAFGDATDMGKRVGLMLTGLAIGALVGPPISGAIYSATGGFEAVGYFAGSAIVLGTTLMFLARHIAVKRLGIETGRF